MSKNVTARLFGSRLCKKCMAFKQYLEDSDIPFEYVDAMADDTQDLCDEQGVDELPHVQILKDGKAVHNSKGDFGHSYFGQCFNAHSVIA